MIILGCIVMPVSADVHTISPGTSIQSTINAVDPDDVIVLNPGVYEQDSITITRNIRIEAAASHDASDTIIDAMENGRIFENTGGYNLTINNLTLRNGTIEGYGGAIYNEHSTVFVNSSVLSDFTETDSSGGGQGGAIYSEHGTLYVTSTSFVDCHAYSTSDGMGGAIANWGSTIYVTSSDFTRCSAVNNGGAISNAGTMTVTSSTFSDCSAHWGGGIAHYQYSFTTVTDSVFERCNAVSGGGITADGGLTMTGNLEITGSSFRYCTATYGGAVNSYCRTTLTSCTFEHNSAAEGGAVYSVGPSIRFSRVYNNTAGSGAGVFFSYTGNVINTWWGANADPSVYLGGYDRTYDPWLVLGIAADAPGVAPGGTLPVRANLTWNSGGSDMSADGHVPDGIPVAFTITDGTGSLAPAEGAMETGMNATMFTAPGTAGIVTINATVDGESVSIPVTVYGAVFSAAPTEGAGNFTARFTDESLGPVTMWNWSFGDGDWFNTTDAAEASPLHLYDRVGIFTVNLTVTGSFGTHTMSRPDYITVREPTQPWPFMPTPDERDNDDDSSPSVTPTTTQADTLPLMTVTVNIGGDSKAWQAVVTGTKLSDLIVTGTVQNGPGSNVTAPLGTVFQYISLVPARYNTITKAVISFAIPQAWLDENHVLPGSIVLYHQTANGWEALPTTVLYTKDGTVYFSAESSGFSLFAIAGTPAGTAPVTAATTQGITGSVVQTPIPADVVKVPVTTQTTAPPATAPQPAAPSPLLNIVVVIAAIGIFAGGGFMARRWWIRRQNPALFREYD